MRVVIIGQGYVGLPLAMASARAGYKVIGFDVDRGLVDELNSGYSRIEGIPKELLAEVLSKGNYRASSNPMEMRESEVAVIAVPTPLNENREPDLNFVIRAAKIIGENINGPCLVINESTSYPGTLRNIIEPAVSGSNKNRYKFEFAVSPERVDPGNSQWGIENTPRLYAGLTSEASDLTLHFYSKICRELIKVSSPEVAESAKLFENTFRQVNIALVNEFSLIMSALGVSASEVLDAASTKPYGFMKFNPGLGVGGHCIPVDPSYLAFISKDLGVEPRFINLANKVNLEMPNSILEVIESRYGQNISGKKVLVCGVAYKNDISDTRESPSKILISELIKLGAEVSWYDPLVDSFDGIKVSDLNEKHFDIAIVAVLHKGMNLPALIRSSKYIFDCTGKIPGVPRL